jgi:hypothetical protein
MVQAARDDRVLHGSVRTMVILATVAIGALRLMLRALGPAQPFESATEWTADE